MIVGCFTVLTVVLLILGFNFLKGKDLFARSNIYYVVYDRINGVKKATPIVFNGLRVGGIQGFKLMDDNTIRVTLDIDAKLKIHEGTLANVVSQSVLGDYAIDIANNDPKMPLLEEGKTLKGSLPMTLEEKLTEKLEPFQQKANNLARKLDSLIKSGEYEKTLAEIQTTVSNLNSVSKNMDYLLKNQNSSLNASLNNVENITAELKTTTTNVNKITNEVAKEDIAKTLNKLDQTVSELNATVSKINRGEGTLGKLINDQQLYTNLNQTVTDLNKTINTIDKTVLSLKETNKFHLFDKKSKEKP